MLGVSAAAVACGQATGHAVTSPDRMAAGGYRFVHKPVAVLEGPYPPSQGGGGVFAVMVRLNKPLPRKAHVLARLLLGNADSDSAISTVYAKSRNCYFREFDNSAKDPEGLPATPEYGMRVTVHLKIEGTAQELRATVPLGHFARPRPSHDKALPTARKLGCVA